MHARQGGMTLLEVLLAIVIVAAGLFATAAMQLQALQVINIAWGLLLKQNVKSANIYRNIFNNFHLMMIVHVKF